MKATVLGGRARVRKVAPLTAAEWQLAAKRRLKATNDALIKINKSRGLNRLKIASAFGFKSSGTITNWENPDNANFPDGYRVYLYHHHFGVSADWLIRADPSKLEAELWEALQKIRSNRNGAEKG